MKVEEISVEELLKMQEFTDNAIVELSELRKGRLEARKKANKNNERLNAHCYDALFEMGLVDALKVDKFIICFYECLMKQNKSLSATEINFILDIGMLVGRKTCLFLKEKEVSNETI